MIGECCMKIHRGRQKTNLAAKLPGGWDPIEEAAAT